eukprot:TRINITY_DN669_c0_g1_i1.p1 TRINITY_DN669_c0_g1~~TRINITY_DN669_c0_g1_i1.p1  ORF type:complete len:186 (-),score=46.62 TRINITY_DN669_c0_g1_i1:171-728(-)
MADKVEESKKRPSDEEEEEKPKKKVKKAMPYQLNVNKALDKKHEGKSFAEIVALPPSALQGIAEAADKSLADFKISTIAQMGSWKYYTIACAIATLTKSEEKKGRDDKCRMNINKALDKAFETKSLKEILKAPLSSFQGLTATADKITGLGKMASIGDLAKNKYFGWAHALSVLAEYENADFSSA